MVLLRARVRGFVVEDVIENTEVVHSLCMAGSKGSVGYHMMQTKDGSKWSRKLGLAISHISLFGKG